MFGLKVEGDVLQPSERCSVEQSWPVILIVTSYCQLG